MATRYPSAANPDPADEHDHVAADATAEEQEPVGHELWGESGETPTPIYES